jgi:polysaccharide export outer membrane protein
MFELLVCMPEPAPGGPPTVTAKIRVTTYCVALLFVATACLAQSKDHQPADRSTSQSSASQQKLDGSESPHFDQREPRYILRPGDVFDLQFEFSPEYNQTVTIQPDGFVTLRGVGDLHVSGKNVPELTATLKQAYGSFLAKPVISVVLKDFEKPYFIAHGEVGKPGKYELRDDTTVTEALAIAGGLSNAAKHSQVLLFRRVSQEWVEAREINVKEMLQGKNLAEDIHLKPGDMIYVPQSRWSKVRQFIPYTSLSMSPASF